MSIKLNKLQRCALSLAAASLLTLGNTALAQSSSSAKPELEELVVTGVRMASDIQDTAVAGTVLTGEGMERKNVTELAQIQYAAPGVTIAKYGSANTFNMRGVGRSKVDIDIPSGIQMYRDGVAMFTGYFQNEPYYDMAGVEVLRGPQGTIAGKSAAGGAVFIRTRNPEMGEQSGSVSAAVGNFNMYDVTGVFNTPVGETAALRIAANHMRRDDYYDSIGGAVTGNPDKLNLKSARISLKWMPNEHWENLFKIDINDLDFGGTPASSFGEDPRVIVNHADFNYVDDFVRVISDIKYHFDNGITFSSLTGYQAGDTLNDNDPNGSRGPFDNPAEPLAQQFRSKGDFYLYSQEFNLVSPEEEGLRWVAGIYAQRIESEIPDIDEEGFVIYTNGEFSVGGPWFNDEDDLSVFGNFWYDLSSQLEFELGLRFSRYERVQETEFKLGFGGGVIVGLPNTVTELSENSTDYKVGLNWRPTDEDFFYAFIARGHTTGGINIFPPNNVYDEVEVIDYELGWKGELFDNQLRTQVGVYYQTLDNFQGNFATTFSTGTETRNAEDDSTIYGIEFSGQSLFGNLGLDFGFAYTKTELGRFTNVLVPAELATWITTPTVDLSGSKSPYSPEWTFNVGMEYIFSLANGMTLTPRLDYAHIDEQKDGLYDAPPAILKERDLVNLAVYLDAGSWYAKASVQNATDENYAAAIQNFQNFILAPPRTYSVKLGYNF